MKKQGRYGQLGEIDERPFFHHPQWSVGLILTLAVVSLLLGFVANPIWLVIGSPFILALTVFVVVRWIQRRRLKVARTSDT